MLGNSVEGIGKMWACEAKYSGWVKLQPSPLWRVKVTHRKGSGILDVAFSKFKDISKQISVKSLCDFGGNAPTLAFYSHIKTLLGRRPWFASKVTSGIREQHSVQWKYLLVSRRCWLAFLGLNTGHSAAIRGIKAWTGQSGHTDPRHYIAPHSHCWPADTEEMLP